MNLDNIPVTRDDYHAHLFGEITSAVLGQYRAGADAARTGAYRPTPRGTVATSIRFVQKRYYGF